MGDTDCLDDNLYSRVIHPDWRDALRPDTGELGTSGVCCKGEEAADQIIASILLAHVWASQSLSVSREQFLRIGRPERIPFVIAVAGSAVHVGNPSIVCILERALTRHPSRPKVEILDARRFDVPAEHWDKSPIPVPHYLPAATDGPALFQFLVGLKAGADQVDPPDILLLFGPTLLSQSLHGQHALPFIFDYFDFSIYVDTAESHLAAWYEHLLGNELQGAARGQRARSAPQRWLKAVRRNLALYVKPTCSRADLILQIGENGKIEDALVRKI